MLSVLGLLLASGAMRVRAQDAQAMIRTAVQTELAASHDDKTLWRYRDEEHVKGTVSIVVQTTVGSVNRAIERDGHALSESEAAVEDKRIRELVGSPGRLAKAKKDADSDDKSASDLLKMLPEAFTWRIASEDASSVTLAFAPNPNFRPADMQARVLGAMGGELVVDKGQHRIKTISGRLTQDVVIGYGLLGRLKQGGTFRVERRQLKPKLWQITETHVHIDGKALLFKSIGQQQDEVQTEFTIVPPSTTLEQALELSKPGR